MHALQLVPKAVCQPLPAGRRVACTTGWLSLLACWNLQQWQQLAHHADPSGCRCNRIVTKRAAAASGRNLLAEEDAATVMARSLQGASDNGSASSPVTVGVDVAWGIDPGAQHCVFSACGVACPGGPFAACPLAGDCGWRCLAGRPCALCMQSCLRVQARCTHMMCSLSARCALQTTGTSHHVSVIRWVDL
jgi:hypothetical protein